MEHQVARLCAHESNTCSCAGAHASELRASSSSQGSKLCPSENTSSKPSKPSKARTQLPRALSSGLTGQRAETLLRNRRPHELCGECCGDGLRGRCSSGYSTSIQLFKCPKLLSAASSACHHSRDAPLQDDNQTPPGSPGGNGSNTLPKQM